MTSRQETVFRDGEGDAWFARNRDALLARNGPDWVEFLVSLLGDKSRISSVCDLGCANGWRLARLASLVAPGARLTGVDASAAAIADGRARYGDVTLMHGIVEAPPPLGAPFDLVIASFVLHWIARRQLASAIAAIDGIVTRGGYLALADFLPDRPTKRIYHHLPGEDVWTFKQDYAQCFLGLGLYREIARVTFDHAAVRAADTGSLAIEGVGSADRCAAVLLQKTEDGYVVA